MKLEIEIPDGKYCGACLLLGATRNTYSTDSEPDCNWAWGVLTYDDGDYNHENPIKHSSCPNPSK